MASSSASSSLSIPTLSLPSSTDRAKRNAFLFLPPTDNSSLAITSPLTLSTHPLHLNLQRTGKVQLSERRITKTRRPKVVAASSEESLLSDNSTDQIISATANGGGGDVTSIVISALLFIAFVGLSILTIGVVYIGVTDFLRKRETERFEKEQAANKKATKGGKKKTRVTARAGPRGFGQKIDQDDTVDND